MIMKVGRALVSHVGWITCICILSSWERGLVNGLMKIRGLGLTRIQEPALLRLFAVMRDVGAPASLAFKTLGTVRTLERHGCCCCGVSAAREDMQTRLWRWEKVCKLDASCGGKLARCSLASYTRGGA